MSSVVTPWSACACARAASGPRPSAVCSAWMSVSPTWAAEAVMSGIVCSLVLWSGGAFAVLAGR
jgi:hypothetical protein